MRKNIMLKLAILIVFCMFLLSVRCFATTPTVEILGSGTVGNGGSGTVTVKVTCDTGVGGIYGKISTENIASFTKSAESPYHFTDGIDATGAVFSAITENNGETTATVLKINYVAMNSGVAKITLTDLDIVDNNNNDIAPLPNAVKEITITANNPGGNTTPGDNTIPGNNTTPGDNTIPGNNTTPGDNTIPGNNTTPVNNTIPGNNTTPVNNTIPGNNIISGNNSTQGGGEIPHTGLSWTGTILIFIVAVTATGLFIKTREYKDM